MPYCQKCGNKLSEDATYCPKCGTPVQNQQATQLRLAFWGERFVAWLIDILIIAAIIWPIRTLGLIAWPALTSLPDPFSWFSILDFGFSNILYFLYWTLMEGIYGQSFGKMIMRIKTTNLDGKPINIAQAAIESVGKAFLLPLDCILGWILHPRKRQRIFNYLSQTLVIRSSPSRNV
jgi:uncharacterized RDD family membrane protein YckC